MSYGFDKRVIEQGSGLPAGGLIIPPQTDIKKGWVTLFTWTQDDAKAAGLSGPSRLYRHIGADLGDTAAPGSVLLTFPHDIKSQWLRASADGLTQRKTHAVGTSIRWADDGEGPETLTIDDFPLKVQIWHEGGVLVVTKAIACIDSPDSRIAEKVAP